MHLFCAIVGALELGKVLACEEVPWSSKSSLLQRTRRAVLGQARFDITNIHCLCLRQSRNPLLLSVLRLLVVCASGLKKYVHFGRMLWGRGQGHPVFEGDCLAHFEVVSSDAGIFVCLLL